MSACARVSAATPTQSAPSLVMHRAQVNAPVEPKFVVHTGDASQLVQHSEVLERLGLHVNRVHRFISCAVCGFVLTGHWERHLSTLHRTHPTADDVASVTALVQAVLQPVPMPTDDTPVQGLRTIRAQVCSCGFASSSKNVQRHHQHEPEQPRVAWSSGWVQRTTTSAKFRQVRGRVLRSRWAIG